MWIGGGAGRRLAWQPSDVVGAKGSSRWVFSVRRVEVRHVRAFRFAGVEVFRGVPLLFGIGAVALPAWDWKSEVAQSNSRPDRDDATGTRASANSPRPSSREGRLSTGWRNFVVSLMRARRIAAGSATAEPAGRLELPDRRARADRPARSRPRSSAPCDPRQARRARSRSSAAPAAQLLKAATDRAARYARDPRDGHDATMARRKAPPAPLLEQSPQRLMPQADRRFVNHNASQENPLPKRNPQPPQKRTPDLRIVRQALSVRRRFPHCRSAASGGSGSAGTLVWPPGQPARNGRITLSRIRGRGFRQPDS